MLIDTRSLSVDIPTKNGYNEPHNDLYHILTLKVCHVLQHLQQKRSTRQLRQPLQRESGQTPEAEFTAPNHRRQEPPHLLKLPPHSSKTTCLNTSKTKPVPHCGTGFYFF